MRGFSLALAVSVCLYLAGVAGAAAFSDDADGNWSAAETWAPTIGAPPASGDTATLDDHTVTLDMDLTGADAPDQITLAGGTLKHLGTKMSNWQTYREYTVDSPVDVTAASTVSVPAIGTFVRTRLILNGPITGTGQILASSDDPQTRNSATAELYVQSASSTFSGGWDIQGGLPVFVKADQAMGNGTVDVTSGSLRFDAAQTYAVQPRINVHSGGWVWLNDPAEGPFRLDLDMYGGAFGGDNVHDTAGPNGGRNILAGTVNLHADSFYRATREYDQGLQVTGTVQGTGKLTVIGTNKDSPLVLSNPQNSYSGGTDVQAGMLITSADTVLGDGTVRTLLFAGTNDMGDPINGTWHGPFTRLVAQGNTSPYAAGTQPLVEITANTMFSPSGKSTALDVTLREAAIVRPTLTSGGNETSGTLTLDGEVFFQADMAWASGDLTCSGPLVDGDHAGKVRVERGGWREVKLTNPANSYSGGTDVLAGLLNAGGAGALGTGSVVVTDGYRAAELSSFAYDLVGGNSNFRRWGGRLKTTADGALNGPSSVTVDANGLLNLASTETALVTIKTGGALVRSGGQTTFTYAGAGQNFDLQPGAILDDSLGADVPDYAVVAALTGGDGRYGVYKGVEGADAAAYTFGDDGANIYRGLAALSNNSLSGNSLGVSSALTYSGTAGEAGSDGMSFYAHTAGQLTLDGAAGCTLNTDEAVYVDGGGTVAFNGTVGGTFATVEKSGMGSMVINSAAGLSGKTVNVHEGFLRLGAAGAADGATINIDPNSAAVVVLNSDISAGTGTITVAAGGYARIDNEAGVASAASARLIFQGGSKIMLDDYDVSSAAGPIGGGKADIIVERRWGYTTAGRLPSGGVELGDGSRLTIATSPWGEAQSHTLDTGSGPILMSAAATQKVAMVCAPTGETLSLFNVIHLGADSTLVIGAIGDYAVLDQDGDNGGFGGESLIGQAGTVRIVCDDPGNVLDHVRVDAGRLVFKDPDGGGSNGDTDGFGGLRSIELAGGNVEFWIDDFTYAMTLSGSGQVLVGEERWGTVFKNDRMTLTPTETVDAALSPGASVGTIDIDGKLGFGLFARGTGTAYGQVIVDIADDDANAGSSHDYVTTTHDASVNNAELVVSLPLPRANLDPAALAAVDMTVLTCGNSLSGAFASVVPGASTDSHWVIDAPNAVTVDAGADVVILHGSAITWTGTGGDATLDDKVTYLDLGILATNYGKTGMDWSDADFTFDGSVTYLDLGILATNYGWEGGLSRAGPSGGGVPEPASATLIVVGSSLVCLLRKRRR